MGDHPCEKFELHPIHGFIGWCKHCKFQKKEHIAYAFARKTRQRQQRRRKLKKKTKSSSSSPQEEDDPQDDAGMFQTTVEWLKSKTGESTAVVTDYLKGLNVNFGGDDGAEGDKRKDEEDGPEISRSEWLTALYLSTVDNTRTSLKNIFIPQHSEADATAKEEASRKKSHRRHGKSSRSSGHSSSRSDRHSSSRSGGHSSHTNKTTRHQEESKDQEDAAQPASSLSLEAITENLKAYLTFKNAAEERGGIPKTPKLRKRRNSLVHKRIEAFQSEIDANNPDAGPESNSNQILSQTLDWMKGKLSTGIASWQENAKAQARQKRLAAFLADHNLQQYEKVLCDHGFNTIKSAKRITEDDLDKMEVVSYAGRRRLLKHLGNCPMTMTLDDWDCLVCGLRGQSIDQVASCARCGKPALTLEGILKNKAALTIQNAWRTCLARRRFLRHLRRARRKRDEHHRSKSLRRHGSSRHHHQSGSRREARGSHHKGSSGDRHHHKKSSGDHHSSSRQDRDARGRPSYKRVIHRVTSRSLSTSNRRSWMGRWKKK